MTKVAVKADEEDGQQQGQIMDKSTTTAHRINNTADIIKYLEEDLETWEFKAGVSGTNGSGRAS